MAIVSICWILPVLSPIQLSEGVGKPWRVQAGIDSDPIQASLADYEVAGAAGGQGPLSALLQLEHRAA